MAKVRNSVATIDLNLNLLSYRNTDELEEISSADEEEETTGILKSKTSAKKEKEVKFKSPIKNEKELLELKVYCH